MSNLFSENKSLPTTQHAVLMRKFGEPEVMQYQDGVAMPEPDDEQVLIKVAYAGINPVDYKTRQGKGWGAEAIQKDKFDHDEPAILGFDVAGTVVKSNSAKYAVGDKVAALTFGGGCYAQFVAVDANLLAKVPKALTLEQAGALPCVGQTALQFVESADIKAGEYVVMNAPAGGVGQLVVQLLMDKAAKDNIKVTVICSPDKYDKLDQFINKTKLEGWIDYTKDEDFPDLQADVLLDLVGDDAGVRALKTLKSGGRVNVLPTIWVDKLKEAGSQKNLQVDGFKAERSGQSMAEALEQVTNGELKLHIQKTYPLPEVALAHTQLQKGDTFGKIVLAVADDKNEETSTDEKTATNNQTSTSKEANKQDTTDTSTKNNGTADKEAYESQVRQQIQAWKNPEKSFLDEAFAALSKPIDKAGERLMAAPQFGETLKQATEKMITTLSDTANWTLDVQDAIEAYQNETDIDGSEVKKLQDIENLPIAIVDKQVKLFKSKYVALTSAQGVATGIAGWAGIPADIMGLITANLRAIGEYATYYGFDMSDKNEQLFAMSLLAVATSASAEERQSALDDTFSTIKDPEVLAFNKVNEKVASRVLRQTATKVATNMVKTKAAQIIPAVGAMVAGGVNASYTSSVCEAAYQCYRERFLDRQAAE
ncbi:EcsC family protein [uncultured Psychrobacter sp.]|uniref:EcsC family protein n=1 Tax=uncultured Psychrobacter sp. TaxID=259303 RepID=UPI003459B67C